MTLCTRTCFRNKKGNYSVEESGEIYTYTHKDHRNKARPEKAYERFQRGLTTESWSPIAQRWAQNLCPLFVSPMPNTIEYVFGHNEKQKCTERKWKPGFKINTLLQSWQTYLGILHHALLYPTAFKQSVSFKKGLWETNITFYWQMVYRLSAQAKPSIIILCIHLKAT